MCQCWKTMNVLIRDVLFLNLIYISYINASFLRSLSPVKQFRGILPKTVCHRQTTIGEVSLGDIYSLSHYFAPIFCSFLSVFRVVFFFCLYKSVLYKHWIYSAIFNEYASHSIFDSMRWFRFYKGPCHTTLSDATFLQRQREHYLQLVFLLDRLVLRLVLRSSVFGSVILSTSVCYIL